jgi:paraquat-inducible protein A
MTREPAIPIRTLLVLAAVTLGLGLTLPCMKIEPSFGEYDNWVRLLDPSLTETSTYSVLTGILAMFRQGAGGIGVLLSSFSVFFPIAKIALMAAAVEGLRRGEGPHWLMGLVHHAGKFSMLDVWVVAVFVVAIKGMPGETEIRLGWGVYLFAASVLLSIAAGVLMRQAEKGAS